MLTRCKVTAMLPVVEMARARKFYEGTLGLAPPTVRPNGEARYGAGDVAFALYPRSTPTRADHTALSFEVKDLAAEMRDLRARGVRFEEYDLPGLKTEDGVATLGDLQSAWFKDSEGNVLAVTTEQSKYMQKAA